MLTLLISAGACKHIYAGRFFMAVDEIFCIFVGDVENISDLRKHYGLSRNSNEATLIIEVYKVLRDRAPYPSDQVIKDLVGNFAFILYDAKSHSIFAARVNTY